MVTESHSATRIGAAPAVQVAACDASLFIRRPDVLNAVTDLHHTLSHDEVAVDDIDAVCREVGLIHDGRAR